MPHSTTAQHTQSKAHIAVGGYNVLKTTATELAHTLLKPRALGRPAILFFANTNFVVQCRHLQPQMEQAGATIVNDGVGMAIAARLTQGNSFPENLNGTDFLPHLFRQAPAPLRIFLVGGKPQVLERAAAYATRQLHQTVVGTCDGYAGMQNLRHLIDSINQAQADVVLVALGNPLQEKWILEHYPQLQVRLITGVGALFDFWAGDKPRAPRLIQKIRMEWFYRLCLEPKRLARRYTIDIVQFLLLCFRYR